MQEQMIGYKPSPEEIKSDAQRQESAKEKRSENKTEAVEKINLDNIEIETEGEKNQVAYDIAKKEMSNFIKTIKKIDNIYQSGELSGNPAMLSVQKVSSRIYKELDNEKIKKFFQLIYDLHDDKRKEKNYDQEYLDNKTGFKEKRYNSNQKELIEWYNNAVADINKAIEDYKNYTKKSIDIVAPSKLENPKPRQIF